MKKLILISLFSIISLFGYSQTVTNNFEDGNWLYYSNHCWGIGVNNEYERFSTKVTGNGFNGTDVCETDDLGKTNICRLESPWIDLKVGNITFNHAVPSKDGTRKLKVYLIDQEDHKTLLFTHSYTNGNTLSAIVSNNKTGIYKVQWEWTGNNGHSRGQLDEIIIPGTNVSDPSHDCEPFVVSNDTDDDGVNNDDDEYPTDPDRAYNNYYPATDTSTLAFEDLWPNYGDYDLNDLVIGYKFKIVTNGQNKVVEIFNTLKVRAQGAGLLNGFGYQLEALPINIKNVNGVGDQTGYDITSNGVENNNSKATFIIFKDSHDFMSRWNTIVGEELCSTYVFNVYIEFDKNEISFQQLNISSWNPFMVINSERGKEVHLPNYEPTDLVDQSYFGTCNDDTQPGINKYYKSNTNLPWAIDIYGKFDYPTETSDISNAYLHFQEWVLSNGSQYQDWWSNKGSGYRNDSLIY